MATGPWTYRAYASGDNPAGQVAALGSCIGCLSLMGIFLFDPYATGSTIVTAFLVPFIATNLLTIPFHIRQMKLLSTVPL
jgi:hypothetical protein